MMRAPPGVGRDVSGGWLLLAKSRYRTALVCAPGELLGGFPWLFEPSVASRGPAQTVAAASPVPGAASALAGCPRALVAWPPDLWAVGPMLEWPVPPGRLGSLRAPPLADHDGLRRPLCSSSPVGSEHRRPASRYRIFSSVSAPSRLCLHLPCALLSPARTLLSGAWEAVARHDV